MMDQIGLPGKHSVPSFKATVASFRGFKLMGIHSNLHVFQGFYLPHTKNVFFFMVLIDVGFSEINKPNLAILRPLRMETTQL